jgi:16S rRNA (adenine1518-N6/adenine1519-N6)-dimethyltransferase
MGARLGQHFLKNKAVLRKIVAALDLKDNDTVVEIGAGHGELTKKIKKQNAKSKIIAIEKDKKLAENLRNSFVNAESPQCEYCKNSHHSHIEVIQGDVLKILSSVIAGCQLSGVGGQMLNVKIVGNIPYYLTGHLLRILSEVEPKPISVVLTIQKEVAERIAAQPPKMNLLAAITQFWAEPKIVGYIPKKDFSPPPKVDSAIIKLTPKTQNLKPKTYYSFVKILFKQPRKTVRNNLRDHFNNRQIEEIMASVDLKPEIRPQNLDVNKISKLARISFLKKSNESV